MIPRKIAILTTGTIGLVFFAGCGGGGGQSGQPQATLPSSIGTYEDPHDFESFGAELDDALANEDPQFFLENVSFQEVSCAAESPPPPSSCAGKPSGAEVPAVLVGAWESEDFYLDAAGYEAFIRDFLTQSASGESDVYGGPEARLYAYAIIRPELAFAPPAVETIEAILTRIAPTTPPKRETLLVTLSFDGEQWSVTQLVTGPVAFLDSHGPVPPPGLGLETIFQFWAPWKRAE